MASVPDHLPATAGASGLPVKPASEVFDRESVPNVWLLDYDDQDQADRIDRLSADYQWVNDLALARFEGAQWDFFVEELAKYGMGVIGGWMRTGLIWERCREKGLGGLPAVSRPFTKDELAELTGETVSKALHHFKFDVLMKQKWDYRKGASLRTYFVGQCMIRFANIYRRWWGNEVRSGRALLADDPHLNKRDPRVESPESDAIDHVLANDVITMIKDERVRKAMIWAAAGRTQAEIAVDLEVSEKTVERMLYNERQRLRKRGTAWQ